MEGTGAELLVAGLKAEKVSHLFGVCGSPVLPILDVIYRTPEIQYIQGQHELLATYTANGYARTRKGAAVCLVSPGPGAAHALPAMTQAFYSSTPTILLAGEPATEFHGRGASLHHDLDAVALFRPITRLALRVERADRILESLRCAFRAALGRRKGPVYLGIPRDLLTTQARGELLLPDKYRSDGLLRADPHDVEDASELLLKAEQPVILAGGGAAWAGAGKEILELAEILGLPVGVTVGNKGLIPEDHPLALGTIGHYSTPYALKAVQEADLILAIGCTFGEFTTAGHSNRIVPAGAKIIQVDLDENELGKIYPIEVGIVGDAKITLQAILQLVRGRAPGIQPFLETPRIKRLLKIRREWEEKMMPHWTSNKVPIQFPRLLYDLRQALPRETIVAGESGGTHMWFEHAFVGLEHTTYLGGWHAMGAEFCESLGAKVAAADRIIVCLTGDGSMMMSLQELATAAKYNIAILCVVTHNAHFGNMRQSQIVRYGGRFIGTDLPIPNLARVAVELGCHGERIEKPQEIIAAVKRALASGKPALLEVVMDTAVENLVPPTTLRGSREPDAS